MTESVQVKMYHYSIEIDKKRDDYMALEKEGTDKIERVLGIYTKLMNGSIVNKTTEAFNYGVNERSIQRDIDDIRNYMDLQGANDGIINSVIYDRQAKGYKLEQIYKLKFTNPEILAICKILLDSRAFTKSEMDAMLQKLIESCVPEENQKLVKELIMNEEFHYIEPHHKSVFIDTMWSIGRAIYEHKFIEIKYQGIQGSEVKTRKLKPMAIMFSEYYFYLAAEQTDEKVKANFSVVNDANPTIYRIDRIQDCKILDEKFHVEYMNRFEEGEYRKRIQFMFGGKLRKVRFKYLGYSVEAVLDKLPTAKIIGEEPHDDGKRTIYTISAEVFGDGIDMWLRSQGENIKLI